MSNVQKEGEPLMLSRGVFSCQVCVPAHWSDDKVREFAEKEYPCGTSNGWFVREEGDPRLAGDPARNQCVEHASHVHIVLDA